LQVFSLGLFLSYLHTVATRAWPDGAPWMDAPLIALGTLVLIGFARLLERRRAAPATARQPA
jgi:hypothetical protein